MKIKSVSLIVSQMESLNTRNSPEYMWLHLNPCYNVWAMMMYNGECFSRVGVSGAAAAVIDNEPVLGDFHELC